MPTNARIASRVALVAAFVVACDPPADTSDVGVDAPSIDAPRDAGPPDCDADPLLPGCVPSERPPFGGISAEVRIVRDRDGVPHVYGATSIDVMYGSGYVQAVDRLFEMELARRRALGRRAEVLGEAFVEGDRLVRVVNIPRWGRTNEAALFDTDPELWALLQAWTEGVNARIDEVIAGTAPLPPEFTALGFMPERWDLSDGPAFGKLVLFGNANQLEYTILGQILTQYMSNVEADLGLIIPFRDSYVLPPEERPTSPTRTFAPDVPLPPAPAPADAAERIRRFQAWMRDFRPGASNNWAVDGRHTDNGRPLIAGDPHQPLQSPSLFWMHHMSAADGSLEVAGWSFVGGPAVQLGHNRDVAWTATTTYGDMMDVWDVVVSGGMARVHGENVPLLERTERIEVAGGEPIEYVVQEVPGYGVLLPTDIAPLPVGRPGRRLLFRWTGFGVTHEFEGFIGFDRATSRDEFERAADRIELGLFNFLSADEAGISYRSSPRVPDRGPPSAMRRPYLVLDGDDPLTFWNGTFLDAARLPHSRGGTRGWLGSANNDPFGFMADGSIDGDPFYYGVFFDPGIRSARIDGELERLTSRGTVTLADMEALQGDTYTLYADDYIPVLEAAWAALPTDAALAEFRGRPELDALVTRLSAWDRRMERTSSEAVIFHAYMFFLAELVLRDDMALVFDAILDAESAYILKWLSAVVSGRAPNPAGALEDTPLAVYAARALVATEAWLRARFPGGTYTWADIHGTIFGSLYGERLRAPWVPTDGSCGTINRSDTTFFESAGTPRTRFDSSDGSIYRMVASFRADGAPEAFFTMGQGNAGEPTSPHWSDLHDDWVETRYRRLRFLPSEVMEAPTEVVATLRP